MITITGTDELTRECLRIGTRMPFAQMRAINHTLAKAKTRASAAIVADLGGGITKRAVDRSLFIRRATLRDLSGDLSIGPYLRDDGQQPHKLGRIPMSHFRPLTELPRGVQAGRMFAPRAFTATLRSGHRAVFRRRRGDGPTGLVGRLPIDERFGPSPLRVFRNVHVEEAKVAAERDLAARLRHEVDVILRGIVPTAEAA